MTILKARLSVSMVPCPPLRLPTLSMQGVRAVFEIGCQFDIMAFEMEAPLTNSIAVGQQQKTPQVQRVLSVKSSLAQNGLAQNAVADHASPYARTNI